MKPFRPSAITVLSLLFCGSALSALPVRASDSIIPNQVTVSTVPANGDINPYGVAFVPHNYVGGGVLNPGDILVSNFNNSSNLQGTGTTIVRVSTGGQVSTFFQGPMGLGLTTALGVLKRGFVVVGNVPTMDGTFGTIQQGSLLILDHNGAQVATLTDASLLNGPWDLTIHDGGEFAQVFVSNVLSGTVTRIDFKMPDTGGITVKSMTQIASGYLHRGDSAALAIGPTGLAYDGRRGLLYVASTGDNAIFAIPDAGDRQTDAGMGAVVYTDNAHLRGPLGLALSPNGHLLTTNGDAINPNPNQPSELVEFTQDGKFVAQFSVNPNAQGGAFGIAVTTVGDKVRIATVDDVLNRLDIWTFTLSQPH